MGFRGFVLLQIVLLSACAGLPPTSPYGEVVQEQEIPLLPNVAEHLKVNRYVLENGLTLLVVEDHGSPTFAYQTWYDVGSRDESKGRTGLAHLFEHMMFKQTSTMKDGEFDRILEIAGAEGVNAFTSRDYTAYIQELPAAQLNLIARLEADRMANLIVNDQAFKTETEVVQNERRYRNENSPTGRIYQELYEVAFTKHPYHWPVIGYQEDLDSMSATDALHFYRKYYAPNRATVVVVGGVDADDVLEAIQKYYGSIRSQKVEPRNFPKEPAQRSPKHRSLRLNIQVEQLMMGYRTPAIDHPDTAALAVLRAILTGGNSSRLNRALVETGIASSVGSWDPESADPGLFIIAVSLQKGKRAALAEKAVLRELKRIATHGPTPREMERAMNIINYSFYQRLETNYEKASFLGKYSILGKTFERALAIHEQIQKIGVKAVQRVAKRYFAPSGRIVIIGVPK